ncbi:taste receptor type 1 member 2 isoform X2 [Gasterosteus aculeatus]
MRSYFMFHIGMVNGSFTSTMKPFFISLLLLESFLHESAQCTVQGSEFHLEGDYLLAGLFDIHHDSSPVVQDRPEAINCSSKPFIHSSYRRFQLMRFSVEEINNSTDLLPNVSLGYEIFDHCSDIHSFPGILKLLSVDGLIQPWAEPPKNLSKVMAVVGTHTSTQALTVAPLFMMDLIPMVSYGAASSVFSRKQNFPSFLRTVHPNKDVIEVIVNIIQHFNWSWVAFLHIDDDYGNDGRELFIKKIDGTEICLGYTKGLDQHTNYSQVFRQIEAHQINAIIVFAPEWTAEALIKSAIQQNVTNKVWIAGDAWSLNKELPKEKGIHNIGTILGVSEPKVTIPGFSDFIHHSKGQTHCENAEQSMFCNQVCNCSSLKPEEILNVDPSFNFPVYAAVHAIAHALHNTLQCDSGRCNRSITAYPYMFSGTKAVTHRRLAFITFTQTCISSSTTAKFSGRQRKCLLHGVPKNVMKDLKKSQMESTDAVSNVKSVRMALISTKQGIPTSASTVRTQNGLQQEAHHVICGSWSSSHSQTLVPY